jgi:hypothetical protein
MSQSTLLAEKGIAIGVSQALLPTGAPSLVCQTSPVAGAARRLNLRVRERGG